uniref:Uncharacterized protein n=1 Tax=Arundo donax TaxID=35708 RepID=A0A0A9AW78_ARUDO
MRWLVVPVGSWEPVSQGRRKDSREDQAWSLLGWRTGHGCLARAFDRGFCMASDGVDRMVIEEPKINSMTMKEI